MSLRLCQKSLKGYSSLTGLNDTTTQVIEQNTHKLDTSISLILELKSVRAKITILS